MAGLTACVPAPPFALRIPPLLFPVGVHTASVHGRRAVCERGVHEEPSRRAPERRGDATREGVCDGHRPITKNRAGVIPPPRAGGPLQEDGQAHWAGPRREAAGRCMPQAAQRVVIMCREKGDSLSQMIPCCFRAKKHRLQARTSARASWAPSNPSPKSTACSSSSRGHL